MPDCYADYIDNCSRDCTELDAVQDCQLSDVISVQRLPRDVTLRQYTSLYVTDVVTLANRYEQTSTQLIFVLRNITGRSCTDCILESMNVVDTENERSLLLKNKINVKMF